MKKGEKLRRLFDPEEKGILLKSFLGTEQVRHDLANYLRVSTERELLDVLGVDLYFMSFRDISQNECGLEYYRGPALKLQEKERICPLGIRWLRKVKDDKFGVDEALDGPFFSGDITEQDVLRFAWPDPADFDFEPLANECERNADRIIVGGLWSAIQGDSSRMMGFENFLLNIALNRPLIKTLVNRVTDFYLDANRRYFEAVKGKMDVFFMGNDFGSQNGLMISEEDWLDIYDENYRKLIDLAHHYGFRVMVHSCGGIEPLIPHFIDMGVDILDPVQVTAEGMDPGRLGEKYGKHIAFHGGVDTQNVLPFGTPGEVAEHCRDLVSSLNIHGTYILAPSNNILPGTPCKNILSMYETSMIATNAT